MKQEAIKLILTSTKGMCHHFKKNNTIKCREITFSSKHCEGIFVFTINSAMEECLFTARDVIRISRSSILRIIAVTLQKYRCHSRIKMSACLLLNAGSGANVIYRSTQNGPGPTKT